MMQSTETAYKPAATEVLELPRSRGSASMAWAISYFVVMTVASIHLYFTPIYSMDSIQYMGNALLMEERDPVRIHERVYAELRRSVPRDQLPHLLGDAKSASDQDQSRAERAANPQRFAEFLPLFAIRPLYNQALYLVSRTGIGLVPSGVLLSVGSYFLLAVLLFVWIRPYTTPMLGFAASLLCMISPPLLALGRETTSDALATLVAFAALYLIFEKQRIAAGMVLLLASIYFRTDFIVLAGPVILITWLQRRIQFWHAAVLSALAVTSVLCINHFSGDYGIKMLYYRNFVGTPIAPGEMVVHFSARDYASAFRSGITKVVESFFIPFLLVGIVGLRSKRFVPLMGVTLAYVLLHFAILPNWQERWVGVFYLSMIVGTVPAVGTEMAVSPINISGFLRPEGVLQRMKSRVRGSSTFVP